jgi:putative endonuclease
MKTYYVYILASRSRRLYIGVTSDLTKRLAQHKAGVFEGFTNDITSIVSCSTTLLTT